MINAKMWEWVAKASKQKKETMKGTIAPPIDNNRLILAYYGNSYHARCLNVKAINILGNGIKDKNIVAKLNEMSKMNASGKKDSAFSLLRKTILDLQIFGNAYWETPTKDEVFHIPAWTLTKTATGWLQQIGTEKVTFTEDEIWHFKKESMISSIYGSPDYLPLLGGIEDTTKGALDLIATITTYNNNFFDNNAIPDQVLIIKGGDLSPQAEANVQKFFRKSFKGYQNAHKLLYLPIPQDCEAKFDKLQSDTKDAKFMEMEANKINEIIGCHGVPPRLLGIQIPGKLGGSSDAEGEIKIFMNTCIKPEQNIFAGQLDDFFASRLNMTTDIEFESYDYSSTTAEQVLKALKN